MTELERVLQRLARLLRGEEQVPSPADAGTQTSAALPADPVPEPRREVAPDRRPGATST